ncbi:uncharacterized protein [Macrobrachium rosenbergii]|uniref:uncharacterized protein isoform X2 n=1 Tax=Macrobrachium rosenbergii TaxID=79674 RepID=UPI0034D51B17
MIRTSLILLAGACLCAATAIYDVDIGSQLKHFTKHRYPSRDYSENHQRARKHIEDTFRYHGLSVKTQKFNTTVNTAITDFNPVDEVVTGVNIMGIAPAISNRPEAVIVVLADYDTNGIDNPMMNNGAGMAVLLETIRLFMFNVRWSQEFQQNFTTVFAALDLNTREHMGSGGKPGGWYFVHEWLWSYLNRSETNFGGAYVIDSVMNINRVQDSQNVNDDFRQMFPDTFERIQDHGHRGDFLAMVTLNKEKCMKLKDQFTTNYNTERIKRPFRLEDMTLPESLSMSRLLASLTRQETIHFWTYEHHNITAPLPALLLTDTETLREVPLMNNCTDLCQLTPEREEFLTTTTLALTRTLLARQAHPITGGAGTTASTLPGGAGTTASTLPGLIMSLASMLLIRNVL